MTEIIHAVAKRPGFVGSLDGNFIGRIALAKPTCLHLKPIYAHKYVFVLGEVLCTCTIPLIAFSAFKLAHRSPLNPGNQLSVA